MPDAERPPSGPPAPLSDEQLRRAWDDFRSGAVVDCPNDGAPLALAVDASVGIYRFVCTRCGTATPWFECAGQGLRVRGSSPSQAPPPAEDA
jgi:hypothetical protein